MTLKRLVDKLIKSLDSDRAKVIECFPVQISWEEDEIKYFKTPTYLVVYKTRSGKIGDIHYKEPLQKGDRIRI
jgi:hypothetical protein